MTVSVTYTLEGSGWAKCEVAIGEHRATITASYLSDALRDLIGAMNLLLKRSDDATASFAEEPGEYRWRFTKSGEGQLEVCILEFPKTFGNRPDVQGKVLFDARCEAREFARAVLSAGLAVLKEHGMKRYKEIWAMHDFPEEKLRELGTLLQDSN